MKTDAQLKTDVTNELQWDPSINVAHVGVAAKDGVVTLTGHLDTFAEKFAIERAAQRVQGVKAVAVELDVKLAPGHKRSDSEIAEAAESAFKWNVMIPADRIQEALKRHAEREARDIEVKVSDSTVTLRGRVDSWAERAAVQGAAWAAPGISRVVNDVTVGLLA